MSGTRPTGQSWAKPHLESLALELFVHPSRRILTLSLMRMSHHSETFSANASLTIVQLRFKISETKIEVEFNFSKI